MGDEPRSIAAVDIDGVLADVRHRLHHVRSRPKDWDAFFAAAPEDRVLEQGRETVTKLAEVFDIVYLSGRPERCRDDTQSWLDRHGLPPGRLMLRRQGDHRPARLMKVEALDRLSAQRRVGVLVDDDPLVLEAAVTAGYDVLPADWMPPDEALRTAQEVEGET
jgi:hypothetical protein